MFEKMGRLNRSDENAGANVQYSKLKDEQSSGSCESYEVMPSVAEYFSFSCKHCGHTQIFQASELEMIIGKSLKMAFRPQMKAESTNMTSASFDQRQNEIVFKKNMSGTSELPRPYDIVTDPLDGGSLGIPLLPITTSPQAKLSQSYNMLKSSQSHLTRGLLHQSNLSSDESNSPTQLNSFKRMTEKPSLMKRIGKGLVVNVSDEEGYPLVSDGSSSIPGSQTNLSIHGDSSRGEATSKLHPEDSQRDKIRHPNLPKNVDSASSFQYGGSISSEEFANAPTIQRISDVDPSVFNRTRDGELKMAPWYQEGIPREIALEILSQEPIGSFMVRKSTTKMGCFALSVRVPRSFQPNGIAHYLIMNTPKGYRIKGFTKEFTTLGSLIAHHSVMPELLPCPLSLSRYHPVCIISDSRRDFADIEPEPDE